MLWTCDCVQLESLQKDANTQLPSDSPNRGEPASSSSSKNKDCDVNMVWMDEVVRELRRVKRQNFVTHCLLSAMIIITAYWQFNEVSLLLTVKEKFSHPLKAVGDMIKGSFKDQFSKPQIEAHLPPIGAPEIPHVDLPSITLNNNALFALNSHEEWILWDATSNIFLLSVLLMLSEIHGTSIWTYHVCDPLFFICRLLSTSDSKWKKYEVFGWFIFLKAY